MHLLLESKRASIQERRLSGDRSGRRRLSNGDFGAQRSGPERAQSGPERGQQGGLLRSHRAERGGGRDQRHQEGEEKEEDQR